MRLQSKKTILSALCVLALALALCAPARAATVVDPLYVGEVDAQTGEALAGPSASAAERVALANGVYYDRTDGSFVYPVNGGVYEVRANVADGMIVGGAVSITAPEDVTLTVARSGTVQEEVDLSNITRPGAYSVSVMEVDTPVTIFRFTIVGAATNLAGGYAMPDGFFVLGATRDGEDTNYDRNYVGMEEEGLYEIEYVCSDTAVHYHLTTTVDRTPPEITLDGELDKKGRYHSAVQVSASEPDVTAVMTRDGLETDFPSDGRLSEAGMYRLDVFDAAGNAATAQFTILVYLNLSGLLFFATVCLTLAVVLAYILVKRKRFKTA